MPVDFSMSSSIRINNDETIDFIDIDDFCADKRCRDRFYIDGLYGFMGIFSLQPEDGFVAKPEYLIRDSKIIDIMAGRLFIGGVLAHNNPLSLVRGHKFIGTMHVDNTVYISIQSYPLGPTLTPPNLTISPIIESPLNISNSINGAKILSGNNYFMKTIENTILNTYTLYHEKGDFIVEPKVEIVVSIERADYSLDGVICSSGIELRLDGYLFVDLNDFIFKYAIISINRYLTSRKSHYSKKSTFTVNKGVI